MKGLLEEQGGGGGAEALKLLPGGVAEEVELTHWSASLEASLRRWSSVSKRGRGLGGTPHFKIRPRPRSSPTGSRAQALVVSTPHPRWGRG